MKAARFKEYGGPSVIEVVETEKPVTLPGKVLVEVHAASLNPFDSKVRAGVMKEMIPLALPVTSGGDIAGVVAEVGDGVTGFAPGDKVYGAAAAVAGHSGAFAEFALTSPNELGRMPANVDFKEAAALVLVGVSAVQGVMEHLNLQPGQKIFIHGAAGGIGAVAVQIAKHVGAEVTGTATGAGVDYVKSLGADKVVDYKTEDFATLSQQFDAVFDMVGVDFDKTLPLLKPGGVALTMIGQPNEALAQELGVRVMRQGTETTTQRLDKLTQLVEAEVVKPHVGQVFPLEQAREAFMARESGAQGKVVLEVR